MSTAELEQIIFEGTTTFGYKEWSGPLVSVSGTSITVTGASGSVLDGDGSRWWDGEGSNGGKTKPKFFYAHSMKSSSITGLTIKNSPVQVFSIDGSTDLSLTSITIDNSAGDSGGAHNTDAFDIGDSTGITITGANVQNQDDCLAVNSGEVSFVSRDTARHAELTVLVEHHLHWRHLLRRPWSLNRLRWWTFRQHRQRRDDRELHRQELCKRYVPSIQPPISPTFAKTQPTNAHTRRAHQDRLRRHRHRLRRHLQGHRKPLSHHPYRLRTIRHRF